MTEEIRNCRGFLTATIRLLPVRVCLALGQLGWKAMLDYAYDNHLLVGKRPKFGHGAEVNFVDGVTLLGSYHPSQQNTFTGRLTRPMLDKVVRRAKLLLDRSQD